MKKIVVVGASGLLGREVVSALRGVADVIGTSRSEGVEHVDISDGSSIQALFERIGPVDAIICVAGTVPFVSWSDAAEDEWRTGLSSKLMGQVDLVRIGSRYVRDGGVILLTSGLLSDHPVEGSSLATTVNAAVDGFVRSAALEIGRGVRVNAVSPGWIAETLQALGMDPSAGVTARDVAGVYVALLDGDTSGQTIPVTRGT